jgi:hypothetical protein
LGESAVNEIIIDANTLPEPLFRLVETDKLRVRKTDGVITMSPIEKDMAHITKLRGSLSDGKLTVDKFLEWTREDKEFED